MQRIKNCLRSIMPQERFNPTMLLSIHKESTDKLHLIDIANMLWGKKKTLSYHKPYRQF